MKYLAWTISLVVGFMSLGQEMLWFRIVGLTYKTIPQTFAFVLLFFLLGIGFGAWLGKQLCLRLPYKLYFSAGLVLLTTGVIDISTVYIIGLFPHDVIYYLFIFAFLIFISAALKAILFPIVHHIGTETTTNHVGSSVSKVYFFNIIGSTLGSLLIGGFFLDYVTVTAMFTLIGLTSSTLGAMILLRNHYLALGGMLACSLALFITVDTHNSQIYQTLLNTKVEQLIENRYGVIHVVKGADNNNIVYGNGVYDGIIHIDPEQDPNSLSRLYVLTALHPQPKRVLVIGLSSGPWVRILTAVPTLEQIDVIELNEGYLQLINTYPEVRPILSDPRVKIYIDDGRRWLKRHPDEKYDLIVMNTTFHWRSGISNLLSQEMLSIIKRSLNPQGIVAFNSTRLPDVLKTADRVFDHASWGELGFIYASDHPLTFDYDKAATWLDTFELDGKPLFTQQAKDAPKGVYQKLRNTQLLTLSELEQRYQFNRPLEVITDSNMINEYKYGLLNNDNTLPKGK